MRYNIKTKPAKANYYLGNLYYDKLQYEKAMKLWEDSMKLEDTFPTVLRNLALSYYNKFHKKQETKELLEKAYHMNEKDARIFLELDQLYKKLEIPVATRLANYENHKDVFVDRDDLYIEYVTLYNMLGRYEEAYQLIMGRTFHPWEGGEGKITTQYTLALVEMAKDRINEKAYEKAIDLLNKALCYPDNLGEGRLEGTKNNHVYYYLGCAYEGLGNEKKEKECFEIASIGTEEPAGMMYYNDQPADMILYQGLAKAKLGKSTEAKARFYKLIDYGKKTYV